MILYLAVTLTKLYLLLVDLSEDIHQARDVKHLRTLNKTDSLNDEKQALSIVLQLQKLEREDGQEVINEVSGQVVPPG